MSFDKGIRLVIDSMLQYVESGSKNIEVGVMFEGQSMNIINDDDIDKIIAEIEEKKKKIQIGSDSFVAQKRNCLWKWIENRCRVE